MATATAEKNVEAKPRQGGGKNDARRLRQSGLIPAVVYGAGQDSQARRRRSQADAAHPELGDRATTPFSISASTATPPRS